MHWLGLSLPTRPARNLPPLAAADPPSGGGPFAPIPLLGPPRRARLASDACSAWLIPLPEYHSPPPGSPGSGAFVSGSGLPPRPGSGSRRRTTVLLILGEASARGNLGSGPFLCAQGPQERSLRAWWYSHTLWAVSGALRADFADSTGGSRYGREVHSGGARPAAFALAAGPHRPRPTVMRERDRLGAATG